MTMKVSQLRDNTVRRNQRFSAPALSLLDGMGSASVTSRLPICHLEPSGWSRRCSFALRSTISEMRDVWRKEHRPVPLQEQTRFTREGRHTQEIQAAPHQPRDEARQANAEDFGD